MSARKCLLWVLVLAIAHQPLAKPRPEPVMMDIAKAMIPQDSNSVSVPFPHPFRYFYYICVSQRQGQPSMNKGYFFVEDASI